MVGSGGSEPVFGAGWANYTEAGFTPAPLRFRKDELGDVIIEGFVKGSGAGKLLFTLPAGYLPDELLPFPQTPNSGIMRMDVLKDGKVNLSSAGVTWTTACCRFRAAA